MNGGIAFILDEHLRGDPYRAIGRHNARGGMVIDVVQVGDPEDLPLGSEDRLIIEWAERNRRIIVARDKATLPRHLENHLALGNHSPGIFLVRNVKWSQVVEYLVCVAYVSEPSEWADRVVFIP